MNAQTRKIKESPLHQGADEKIAYTLTTTPWVSSPTSPVVVLKNEAGTDVSSTNLSGTASATGDVITTPLVQSVTPGAKYRLEVKFTVGSGIYEAWADVYGET